MIECDRAPDRQLTIPLRVKTTDSPQIGVVTDGAYSTGYAQVFSDGSVWSIKKEHLYSLKGTEEL